MDFTEDEKKQLVKWYYEFKSIIKVLDMFKTVYGYERSRKSVQRILQRFQKYGCIRGRRNKCIVRASKGNNNEIEELEIMVCAAAELELSCRVIALELGISKSTVSRILIRNGYGKVDFVPEEFCNVTDADDESILNTENQFDGEMYWEKKKQIIQWYYGGNTPSDIVQLFADTYKHSVPSKAWVCYIIQLFEQQGCIRSCVNCIGVLPKPSDINEDVELEKALIATMPNVILNNNESATNEEKEKVFQSTYSVEFVSVEPTMDTALMEEKAPNKKQKKKVKGKKITQYSKGNIYS